MLILCVFALQIASGQSQKSILINTERDKILIPIISKSLESLSFEGHPYFKTVRNLSEVNTNILNDKLLRGILDHYENKDYNFTSSEEKLMKAVAYELKKHDYFLNIHIHSMNPQVEYQFYLYERTPTSDDNFPHQYTNKLTYYTSFIVDLTIPDYRRTLENEVFKMFPFTNQIPIAGIAVKEINTDSITLEKNDTLTLSSSYSIDFETPQNRLNARWYKRLWSPFTNSITTSVISEGPTFKFRSEREGIQKIYMDVFDGVHYSKPDSLTIDVVAKPEIYVAQKKYSDFSYRSIFGNHENISGKISVTVENNKEADSILVEPVDNGRKIIQPFADADSLQIMVNQLMNYHEELMKSFSRIFILDFSFFRTYWPMYRPDVEFSYRQQQGAINLYFEHSKISFRDKFQIKTYTNGLASNTEIVDIQHKAYAANALSISYSSLAYELITDENDTLFQSTPELKFGLTTCLLAIFRQNILSTISFGIPLEKSSKRLTAPISAEIYFRGRFFRGGLFYDLLSATVPNPSLDQNEFSFKNVVGFSLGVDFKPLKIPMFVVASVRGKFNQHKDTVYENRFDYLGESAIGIRWLFK